jgi:formylglycine-generating enzyme required for sulfatase activity
MVMSYAVDFGRDREPAQKRSRFPEYRRKGSAPARVNGIHCRRAKRWTWGSGRGARTLNARAFAGCLALAVTALANAAFGAPISINYATIGNPGNAAQNVTNWGSVPSVYKIATTETTNKDYVAFLNSVDPAGTNPRGIYNSTNAASPLYGIAFSGTAASGSKYTVKTGTAPSGFAYSDMPVLFTNWFSAARFTNWLANGQTSGTASMESGAYTLNGQVSGPIPTRTPGASVFLPSRDEWYKAAFFLSSSNSYFIFPTSSNSVPTATISNVSLANAANYDVVTTSPITVGSYINSASPYGLYDMLGNVTEFTDTSNGTNVQVFGGSHATPASQLPLWDVNGNYAAGVFRNPANATSHLGFRVAAVPEPTTIALAGTGLAGLAGLNWMKRRKKAAAAQVG